jgi:DNA-binding NarL/FixJ family response regulator
MTLFLAERHVAVGSAGQPFSVLLAADQELALVRIRRALSDVAEFDVVGEAESMARLFELVAVHSPNAVVVNLEIDGSHGLRCLTDLHKRWDDVCIVAVAASDDPKLHRRALKAGASACVSQSVAATDLVTVLREVLGAPAVTVPAAEPPTGGHVTTAYARHGVEFGVARSNTFE